MIAKATKFPVLLMLALLLAAGTLAAQSGDASSLKEKRKRLLRELEQTTQSLQSTRRKKTAAQEQLILLQQQISTRQELITTLRQEVALTDASIDRTEDVIAALTQDVSRLKSEYAATLRAAYRSRLSNGWLTFIFASDNFNQALRRWRYLQQYYRYRERQARLISETQRMLRQKLNQLEDRRSTKAELLATTERQGEKLRSEVSAQNKLVRQLQSDERSLAERIEKQRRDHEALNKQIENAIAAEMAAQRRRSRTNTPGNANTPTTAPAASSFGDARGRLPWPARGTVVKRFGRQPHPEVGSVEINNYGIDIDAGSDTDVKAVFDGEVVTTRFVPGYKHFVLLRHGRYYTVYSNLEVLHVDTGQPVRAGQSLGRTGTDGAALHFELWKEKEKLNPEGWLGAR